MRAGRQAGKEPDFAGAICFRRGTALFLMGGLGEEERGESVTNRDI